MLQALIMQSYKTKIETIRIAEIDYQIQSLLDRQQFSDPEGASEELGISSAMWPIFGQVWPIGLILATIMSKETILGKDTLEIGCGMALSSIVIKSLGGTITASDYHPLTKTFLETNTKLNFLAPINFETGNWNTENPTLGKFNQIIASDILYEPQHAMTAAAFIQRHAAPLAEVIVLDAGRGFHNVFIKEMTKLGYAHTVDDFVEFSNEGKRPKGYILRFSRT